MENAAVVWKPKTVPDQIVCCGPRTEISASNGETDSTGRANVNTSWRVSWVLLGDTYVSSKRPVVSATGNVMVLGPGLQVATTLIRASVSAWTVPIAAAAATAMRRTLFGVMFVELQEEVEER